MRSGPGRWVQVIGGLLRTSVAAAMQYRADFLFDGLTSVFRLGSAVAPVLLVYQHRTVVVGWTEAQATVVLGLYFVLQGVLAMFVEPNLGEIVESIRTGSLDFLLIKPIDAQLIASARRVSPYRSADVLAGVVLVGWSLWGLPAPSVGDVGLAVAMLLAGVASMYSIWLLAICTSFWFVRVDNLRFLIGSATDAGRLPLQVFSRWVQVLLIVVVPVGLFTTFPAMALRGTLPWTWAVAGGAVAVGFVLVSRAVWTAALGSYTSASS
ncbi:MAG: ABC-2 family transporter protein [Myxococcota bacterium]